ncbi:MAG TPA: phosphomannomutase/phosphoglucomutase [bacterium]|nr:phosphomannomutase/phosphoglucomutase [bacterium]
MNQTTSTINSSIFKSYDIRGVYPSDLNEELAYRIAQAYVKYVKPEGKIAVGMDVRTCSPALKKAVVAGLTDAGIDVVDIGLVSTDMYYFTVGKYKLAGGIMVTASHNPAEYGGLKMVREEAKPLFGEQGINQIRDMILANEDRTEAATKGIIEEKDVLSDFTEFVLNFVDKTKIKPMKVVINPNFGYQGVIFKHIVETGSLPIEIIGLNDEPDGTFPKGRPDPFIPENRPEFVAKVKESGADFGIAWDADGDRVFFCTDKGNFVESYYANALFIGYMLDKSPGSKIVYDIRYVWALIDAAKERGSEAIECRVGHSYIKQKMRAEDAIFCGESSGHTYFRDFWYADCGMIPALMMAALLGEKGASLDSLMQPLFAKYPMSGEFNTTVENPQGKMDEIKAKYSDAKISTLDGVTIEYDDWRANIRPSNTEPLLRLNVEAKSQELMEEKRDELLAMIRA